MRERGGERERGAFLRELMDVMEVVEDDKKNEKEEKIRKIKPKLVVNFIKLPV